jgi:oligoribonuclease NrnB/cAMP/cGMP phosphodiesterase (DHH superfamily)
MNTHKNKTELVSHIDLDGYASQYILLKYLQMADPENKNIKLININYNVAESFFLSDKTDKIDTTLYITDINLSQQIVKNIQEKNYKEKHVFDHHQIDELTQNEINGEWYKLDKNVSAALLTFNETFKKDEQLKNKYINKIKQIETFANYVSTADLWQEDKEEFNKMSVLSYVVFDNKMQLNKNKFFFEYFDYIINNNILTNKELSTQDIEKDYLSFCEKYINKNLLFKDEPLYIEYLLKKHTIEELLVLTEISSFKRALNKSKTIIGQDNLNIKLLNEIYFYNPHYFQTLIDKNHNINNEYNTVINFSEHSKTLTIHSNLGTNILQEAKVLTFNGTNEELKLLLKNTKKDELIHTLINFNKPIQLTEEDFKKQERKKEESNLLKMEAFENFESIIFKHTNPNFNKDNIDEFEKHSPTSFHSKIDSKLLFNIIQNNSLLYKKEEYFTEAIIYLNSIIKNYENTLTVFELEYELNIFTNKYSNITENFNSKTKLILSEEEEFKKDTILIFDERLDTNVAIASAPNANFQQLSSHLLKNDLDFLNAIYVNFNERSGTLGFRSKNGKALHLARLYNGGGHPNASGGKFNGTKEEFINSFNRKIDNEKENEIKNEGNIKKI